MKKLTILVILILSCCLFSMAQQLDPVKKLRRADCFFGIHLDFHAGEDCINIGKNFSEALIDSFLTLVKPDFIQVDCKGHPGYSSYPTKVGNPAPGFVKDPLKIWRELTAKHGIALYVHYSGVWDKLVCKQHPDWVQVKADGNLTEQATSVYGPYVDSILIPQMKELIDVYQIDGAWIDGDCWGTQIDYSDMATRAFTKATGINVIPYKITDANFDKFLDFNREGFKRYIAHYANEIHLYHPAFQLTSNWAFSSFMPEPVSVNLDFLSGDLTPQNSVNSAAFEARCMALQGKPWDLMSWAFTLDWDKPSVRSYKSAIQLQQEAAEIIAMGGGFQAYFTQNRDASINDWYLPTMKKLADFVKLRQPFCHNAIPIPQIGLLHSTYGYRAISHQVYNNWEGQNVATQGILTTLLDGQNTVEIVREYTLKDNMSRFPLIIIPEWEFLDKQFCVDVLNYVSKGGNLIIIGAKAVKNFTNELGVNITDSVINENIELVYNNQHSGLATLFQPVELKKGTEMFGTITMSKNYPAASIINYGKGKIAGVYFNMGDNYQNYQTTGMRNFLDDLVTKIFTNPLVEIKGSNLVHVTVNRLNNNLMVNLINTAGKHDNKKIYEYDEVPTIGMVSICLNLPKKPKKITLQPDGFDIKFVYKDGKAVMELPRIFIHSILEVEE